MIYNIVITTTTYLFILFCMYTMTHSDDTNIEDLLNDIDSSSKIELPLFEADDVPVAETTTLPLAVPAEAKVKRTRTKKETTVLAEETTEDNAEDEVPTTPKQAFWNGEIKVDDFILNVYQKLPKEFLSVAVELKNKKYVPIEVYRTLVKEINRASMNE